MWDPVCEVLLLVDLVEVSPLCALAVDRVDGDRWDMAWLCFRRFGPRSLL